MLLCGFESRLGVFSEAHRKGFSPNTPVSSPPSSFNGSANKVKAQINAISTLSNLVAELSLRTMWHVTRHVARDRRSVCCK